MHTTLVIIGLVISSLGIYSYISYRKIKNTPLVADHKNIITLTDKNFHLQVKNRIILIDFWAGWCVPCRMMAPIINDVASELDNNKFVGKIDIQQFPQLAQKFNVRSIPTLILLKDGVELERFVGVKNKEFLMKKIKQS
jgi:thioredoxin 1